MYLTPIQTLIIIGCVALGTMTTRFLPFILFLHYKEVPDYIAYLGKVLPYAVIGLLVVYCLKGISFTTMPFGLPELIGVAGTALLHLWKRNTLLSIGGGTVLYMILVQGIFVSL